MKKEGAQKSSNNSNIEPIYDCSLTKQKYILSDSSIDGRDVPSNIRWPKYSIAAAVAMFYKLCVIVPAFDP